jgi:hypothetical protein
MGTRWLRLPLRALALASFIAVVCVVVGSIWFPLWWYLAIWRRQLWDPGYFLSACSYLLNNEMPFLLGICVVLVLLAFSYRFWARLLVWVDRWAVLIIVVCVLGLIGDALVLYKTQRWTAGAYDGLGNVAIALQDAMIGLVGVGATPSRIEPPVSFYYLDKDQVAALYSQVEPGLAEKERTVSTDAKSGAFATVKGGPVEMKAERSSGASQTSAFKSTEFSPDRKCLELINTTLEHGTARYYTDSQGWVGREAQKYLTGLFDAAQRDGKARSTPLSQPERDAMRARSAAFGHDLVPRMIEELSNASGFVLIEGIFHRHSKPSGGVYFSEEFSSTPRPISFRFTLTEWTILLPATDGMRLRVFGNITHQLGSTDYIEVHPVAVF